MGQINTIKQGESYKFEFNLNGQSIAGWVCTIYLKIFPDDTPILTRVISPTDSSWSGFLTQAETAGLAISHHMLIGKLTNAMTDEEEQQINRFNVAKVWG